MEREVQLGVNSEELKEDVVDVPDQVILVDLALRHLQLPSVHELHSPLQSKKSCFSIHIYTPLPNHLAAVN